MLRNTYRLAAGPVKARSSLSSLARLTAASVLFAGPAHAIQSEAYVSATASDVFDCSTPASACGSLDKAIRQVDPGGTIFIISSGGYIGAFINKSLTISAVGVNAVIRYCTNAGGLSVSIAPSDTVILKGLTLDCLASNVPGLSFDSAGTVHVQDSLLRGYYGVQFDPSGEAKLEIVNSTIADSGYVGPFGPGIQIAPAGSGSADVTLDRVHIVNNNNGIRVEGSGASRILLRDSVVADSPGTGLAVAKGSGRFAAVMVDGSSLFNNNVAVAATGARAMVHMSKSTVTDNRFGLLANGGGQIVSFKDNNIVQNGRNGTATSAATNR